MQMKVNLSGFIGDSSLSEELMLELEGQTVPLSAVLDEINRHLGVKFATKGRIKRNQVVVLLNGEKVDPRSLKKNVVNQDDTLTIMTPIVGG
ncbi:MAG: MoaD/ThiS family protein [Promethearchaeota archaeon]